MDRYLLAGFAAGCFLSLAPAGPAAASVHDLPRLFDFAPFMPDEPAPVAAPTPVPAAKPVPVVVPGLSQADAAVLKPGEYVWKPETARRGPVRIAVSIEKQLAFVYSGDALIGISTVSSGKPRHETPRGTFPILQKHADHHSNIYNNAPMPWMQRLTQDGVALHAGKIPGYPASHGCVRLPAQFAKTLFGVTGVGTIVTIA